MVSFLHKFEDVMIHCATIAALIFMASKLSDNFFLVLGVERACGKIALVILSMIIISALIDSVVEVVLFVRSRRRPKKDDDYDVFTWPE